HDQSAHSRDRVFIVSIRKDRDNGSFEFKEGNNNLVTLESITESCVDEKYYCKDNSYLKSFLNKVKKRVCKDKEPSKFGLMRVGTL
ncbi:DNA cytosine methyltransferase, partial [Clostridium perfringens]